MSNKSIVLGQAVRVRGRFHRSVQLARDWSDGQSGADYIVTSTANHAIEQILTGLTEANGDRCWSITGPYGTGKSAFGLFLTDLLNSTAPKHPVARELREQYGLGRQTLLPVVVVGQRQPFVPSLLRAIADAFRLVDSQIARAAQRLSLETSLDDDVVVNLVMRALDVTMRVRRGGVLFVVDEFGKFLEFAAMHPDQQDLMVLQRLAETIARSSQPAVFVTILHSSFAEYAQTTDDQQRREWRKVQGRFTDIAFLEPPDQLVRVMAHAIERRQGKLDDTYRQLLRKQLNQKPYNALPHRIRHPQDLIDCAPLDPAVALLLGSVFRSKLAQNERSLFAFLTGSESGGFQDFLNTQRWDGEGTPPLFRVDALYDYIVGALGSAVYTGDRAHTWSQIDQSLSRLPANSDEIAASVVKAIGLVSLYGTASGLRATTDLLEVALGNRERVSLALRELKKASIVIYRNHEGAYGLWEGSDIDLGKHFAQALSHLGRQGLAKRLSDAISLRPIVARAHYIRSGTLRYFGVRVIDAGRAEIEAAGAKSIEGADGEIVYVVAADGNARSVARATALRLSTEQPTTTQLRVWAFPQPLSGLDEALRNVEAWRRVIEHVPQLQGDRVAKLEATSSLQAAVRQLEGLAGKIFGIGSDIVDPNLCEWIWDGAAHTLQSARQFSAALSDLCDSTYNKAPVLHNELLNRDRLSSAAAQARRTLIEAMFSNGSEKNLGITGIPPELSMYRSMLEMSRMHRQEEGHFAFGSPGRNWGHVWRWLEERLSKDKSQKHPVGAILAELQVPPYGVRGGPLPVFLTAYILARGEECALFEDGVFVADLRVEVLERLIRRPETFDIQLFEFTDRDRRLFRAVDGALEEIGSEAATKRPHLIKVARDLVLFAARLPAYTKQTRRLHLPQALVIRDMLLRAKDPYQLLYRDLPQALGFQSADADPRGFAGALRDCLVALHRAYGVLLDEIDGQARDVFSLSGTGPEVRDQLVGRASGVAGFAADRQLALFVREASRLGHSDWREMVGRVAMDGQPPHIWKDSDAVALRVRLMRLGSEFARLEELVAEHQNNGAAQVLRVGILNGVLEEEREVIALNDANLADVEKLEGSILQALESTRRGDRRLHLAAIARVAAMLIAAKEK